MAFDPRDMATGGLFPGRVTPTVIANLGHFFSVEIEVVQVPGRGGVGTTRLKNREDKYKVIMRVKYKTRTWEFEQEVSQKTASVIAKMTGAQIQQEQDPEINITSVQEVKPDDIIVKVEKR